MQFNGRYAIPASPDAVWAALNDPGALKASIPGCEALQKTGATTFVGSTKLKIGPMSAIFKGKVEITELDPPRRCVLKGEGQGGVAGFVRGESEVVLAPEDGGTMLSYTAKATVGGKLAQIGQRLLDTAASQLADQFFAKFATQAANVPNQVERADVALGPQPQVPSDSPLTREGVAPEIWVIGLIAIIIILLILFGLVL